MRCRQRQGATPARSGPSSCNNWNGKYHRTARRTTCLHALQLIQLLARIVVRCRRAKFAMRYAGFLHGPVLKAVGGMP